MGVRGRKERGEDLELELLRRIVGRLEKLEGEEDAEAQRLLIRLEVSRLLPSEREVDWGRLLPLLLSLGVVLAVIIAHLLGADVRGAF